MEQPAFCGCAWRVLVVLVVLHLPASTCQVCVSTGDSDAASCTESKTCRGEYYEHQKYIYKDECSPRQLRESSVSFPPGVTSCPLGLIFGYGQCPPDIFGPLNETLLDPETHLYSLSWERFAVNISWPSEAATTGFMIKIKTGSGWPWGCVCVSKNVTSYTFDNIDPNIPISNKYGQQEPMIIEFHWSADLGLPESSNMLSRTHSWPTSCLDVEHNDSTCALPIYDPPTNISICKDPDPSNSTVHISWDYVTDLPQPVFYVRLYNLKDDRESIYVANGTQSIAIMDLDRQISYSTSGIGVQINPYYYCSGVANGSVGENLNYWGCGHSRKFEVPVPVPVPNCSLPTLPVPLPTTTAIYPTATPSVTPTFSAPERPGTPPRTIVIACCAAGSALIIIILITILGIVVRRYYIWKRAKMTQFKTCPPFDSEHSVFVAYVPHDSVETDIQTYVVAPLAVHFPVTTSARKVRGDLVEWIEVQERKASVVLFVITEDFLQEWKDVLCKSHFMEAMRRLVSGSVARGQLEDKYAIAVLEESSRRYIPENGYLRNLNVYVLGEGSSQLQELHRFITKAKKFQHRNLRESSDSSVGSNSECTVSIQLENSSLDEYTLSHSGAGNSPPHSQQTFGDAGLAHLHHILTPGLGQVSCSSDSHN